MRQLFLKLSWVLLIILLMAIFGGLLGLAVANTQEERYRSELLLAVAEPSAELEMFETGEAGVRRSFIDRQIELLRSTEVLRTVVVDENLTRLSEFQDSAPQWPEKWTAQALKLIGHIRQKIAGGELNIDSNSEEAADPEITTAIGKIREVLRLRQRGQSGLIEVSITARSPDIAQKVIEALAQEYISARAEARITRSERIDGLLDEQTRRLRGSFFEANNAVSDLRRKHGILDSDTLGRDMALNSSAIRSELLELQASLIILRMKHDEAKKIIAANGDVLALPDVQDSELIYRLRIEKFEAQLLLKGLLRKNAPTNEVLAQKDVVSEIDERISREILRIVSGMESRIRALERQEGSLQGQLTDAQAVAQAHVNASIELSELENRAQVIQEIYTVHLPNAILESMSLSLFDSAVQIIEPASWASKPMFPTPDTIVLIGLVSGAGLGVLFGLRRRSPKLGAKKMSRNFSLPLLATIPPLSPQQTKLHTTFEIPRADPGSRFAKAVRKLNSMIGDYETAYQAPIVQVTSSEDGEGKSSIASALAASAASDGLSVLLVDADLSRAGLTALMDMEESSGLIELIRDGHWDFEDVGAEMGCVDIMPVGSGVRRNLGLGGAFVLRTFLNAAREHYDLILVDSPSINHSIDAPILSDLSDHIVFLVRKDWGSKESLTRALEQLEKSSIAGLVINEVN